MSRWSKDRGRTSISIGPAIAATSPAENAGKTPANAGTGTGAGDEFLYIPGEGQSFQYPVNIAWNVTISGGTMTALTVNLEVSDDGTNWSTLDTQNSATGGRKVVANTVVQYVRANIATFTANTGSPVVTVTITC